MKFWMKAVLSSLVCFALGTASGLITAGEITDWYALLNKPSWNPPNWIFGPVWTVLYILMGIAFARVWHSDHSLKKYAMTLFIGQFLLNLLWTPVFFGLHKLLVALVIILLLLGLLIYTTHTFSKIDKTAAYLLVPYILWVSFATILNGTIWSLNG